MSNSEINKSFLASTDSSVKASVLSCIANHYSVSVDEAEKEVTQDGAEHLLDYLVEPVRAATYALMQRHLVGRPVNSAPVDRA